MEDRSALFNQLKNFSQRKLKKVETKVVTASGEQLVEKRGAKGLQVLSGSGGDKGQDENAEPPRKLDLQVGLILPGLLLASQDVAHDKSTLDTYGMTHILNLDAGIENKFEDDFNYKNINIRDEPSFELEKVFEDCFDFIDDGRRIGNVLIHCSGTIGLSRSTSICIAYLMEKEKMSYDDAFNQTKEARSFVKPSEGFVKQLRTYEVKLRGEQQKASSGIDDPFALRKKQEIEQEKAMVAGAASVKNRMKMFGATLDANAPDGRSKSVSPSPFKQTTPSPTPSKWSTSNAYTKNDRIAPSKSMTPEPRKSSSTTTTSGPPPPPPPMPSQGLHDKSVKPSNNQSVKLTSSSSSSATPPPPPPPPPGNLLKSTNKKPANDSQSKVSDSRRESIDSKRIFGKVPPPQMKIKGGLSIEKHDPVADKSLGINKPSSKDTTNTSSTLKLPLKKQPTTDSSAGDKNSNPRAPSPNAALKAAKQAASGKPTGEVGLGQLNRSTTKKILNLIKNKTKTDLTLSDGDENDEIEALLMNLENESACLDDIDWEELGLDEDEIKDIIEKGAANLTPSESSSSSSDEDKDEEDDEEEEDEEVETTTQHFVIRPKY